MRKQFVFVVLLPVLLAIIVVGVFIDSWVESSMEYAGEQITGARVEIDGTEVTLFPLGLSWKRLQVADPSDTWTNLFETGAVRFSLNSGQLLRAKFIVETIAVEQLVVGTRRESDGRIEEEEDRPDVSSSASPDGTSFADQASDMLSPVVSSAPVFDLGKLRSQLNLDSLTRPSNLETYRVIDSLDQQLRQAEERWNETLSDMNATRETVKAIEARVRSIDVNSISSIESAQKAFTTAREAYEQTNGVIQNFDERKRLLGQSIAGFSSSISSLDDVARRDYDRVISAARLPDVSMRGLGELFLGRELLSRAEEYLGYVDMARSVIPAGSPDDQRDIPRRPGGVNIDFPEEASYPKLWIKEIVISGGTDSAREPSYFYASGKILNISSDQRLTGEPISAEVEARRGEKIHAACFARFDRRTDTPHDTYKVELSGLPIADMPLGSESFLPSRLTGAESRVSLAVDVPGTEFESSANVHFSSVRISFDRDPSNPVERLTRDVLAGVPSFLIKLRIWKTESGGLDLAFSTDLDDQLSSRARQVIGAEVARLREEIRLRVDAEIKKKRKEIEALYAGKREVAESQIRGLDQDIRSKIAFVETKKREFEDRIEQEKKKAEDALKKKAEDALKGIFRKND